MSYFLQKINAEVTSRGCYPNIYYRAIKKSLHKIIDTAMSRHQWTVQINVAIYNSNSSSIVPKLIKVKCAVFNNCTISTAPVPSPRAIFP